MSEEITIQTINPFNLSVVKFKDYKINDKQEGSLMLEYKKRDIFLLPNTAFYSLLRLLKLPIAEYRKFAGFDKTRLLNVYFRTLSNSLEWDFHVEKKEDTFRLIEGVGTQSIIFSVFSIRKTEIKKKEKETKEKAIEKKYYTSKQDQFAQEKPVYASLILVGAAFCLWFIMALVGGN